MYAGRLGTVEVSDWEIVSICPRGKHKTLTPKISDNLYDTMEQKKHDQLDWYI